MNNALREHVTSVGFNLTLSKRMIDVLVCLDHFKGDYGAMTNWERAGGLTRMRQFGSYITTVRALEARGLVVRDIKYQNGLLDRERSRHRLTRAGKLTVSLLREAGIYQERFDELRLGVPQAGVA